MEWIVVIIVVSMIVAIVTSSRRAKGARGERRVARILRKLPDHYHVFHNVTLKAGEGTSQIDHVVICPFGVLVIETKAMTGNILGSEDSRNWVQHLGRKKFSFYSPLEQNRGHCLSLSKALELDLDSFASIVVFSGDATPFRDIDGVLWHPNDLIPILEQWDVEVFAQEEVDRLADLLESIRLPDTAKTDRAHRRYVKTRKKEKGKTLGPRCSCGNGMVKRQNKTTGDAFWGCRSYPDCKRTKPIV